MLHSMQARIKEFSLIQIPVSKVYIYDYGGNVYVYIDFELKDGSTQLGTGSILMLINFCENDCCVWCIFS
jgi:hypothetical protein